MGEAHLHHLGGGEHHHQEVELAIPRGGHPWDHQEEPGAGEGALLSSREDVVLVEPGAIVGATWEAREKRMGTTNLIPSAVRPTTSRTGARSLSLSSRFNKVETMPVTMVTIMTTRNFIRIHMGSSGSKTNKEGMGILTR